jgi:hypothetical protein
MAGKLSPLDIQRVENPASILMEAASIWSC